MLSPLPRPPQTPWGVALRRVMLRRRPAAATSLQNITSRKLGRFVGSYVCTEQVKCPVKGKLIISSAAVRDWSCGNNITDGIQFYTFIYF